MADFFVLLSDVWCVFVIDQVPENPMDFAAYARARGFDTSNLKAGDSMKVGDMGYTVEDITKSD